MKKTLNINLGSLVFHIDEDAYFRLDNYLLALRKQFERAEGGDEILSDVELRIAELFRERLNEGKQVIVLQDVLDVIAILGKPEDYLAEDSDNRQNQFESEYEQGQTYTKKVFRDVDNRYLGGVSAGLGAYFNIDPLWLRLLFIVLTFFPGIGILIYLILWLVVPAARTTAEKLQMRGKSVTLSNIESFLKEEASAVGAKMKDLSENSDLFNARRKGPNIFQRLGNLIVQLFKFLFKFMFKLIGIVLLGLGLLFLASVFFALISGVNINGSIYELSDLLSLMQMISLNQSIYNGLVFGGGLMLLAPLVFLIYYGLRLIFQIEPLHKGARRALAAMGLIGLVIVMITGARISNSFRHTASRESVSPLTNSKSLIKVSAVKYSLDAVFAEHDYDEFWIYHEGEAYFGNIKLDIRSSSKAYSYLETKYTARGESRATARRHTNNLRYDMRLDSGQLALPLYFQIKDGQLYRGQQIRHVLYLKPGDTIYLEPGIERLLYDVANLNSYWDHDMPGHHWVMTEKGLRCVECEGPVDWQEEPRNDAEDNPTDSLENELDLVIQSENNPRLLYWSQQLYPV